MYPVESLTNVFDLYAVTEIDQVTEMEGRWGPYHLINLTFKAIMSMKCIKTNIVYLYHIHMIKVLLHVIKKKFNAKTQSHSI